MMRQQLNLFVSDIFDNDPDDTIQYTSLVIPKIHSPQFVPLCKEAQISYCLTGAKGQ